MRKSAVAALVLSTIGLACQRAAADDLDVAYDVRVTSYYIDRAYVPKVDDAFRKQGERSRFDPSEPDLPTVLAAQARESVVVTSLAGSLRMATASDPGIPAGDGRTGVQLAVGPQVEGRFRVTLTVSPRDGGRDMSYVGDLGRGETGFRLEGHGHDVGRGNHEASTLIAYTLMSVTVGTRADIERLQADDPGSRFVGCAIAGGAEFRNPADLGNHTVRDGVTRVMCGDVQ